MNPFDAIFDQLILFVAKNPVKFLFMWAMSLLLGWSFGPLTGPTIAIAIGLWPLWLLIFNWIGAASLEIVNLIGTNDDSEKLKGGIVLAIIFIALVVRVL